MKKLISFILILSLVLSACPVLAAESSTDIKEQYEDLTVTKTYEAEHIIYDRDSSKESNIYITDDKKAVELGKQFGTTNGKDESLKIKMENAGTYNVFIKAYRKDTTTPKFSGVYMTTAPDNSDNYTLNGFDIMTYEGDEGFIWQYVGPAEVTDNNNCIYIDAYRTASAFKIAVDKVLVTNNFYYHPAGDEINQDTSGLTNKYNAENTALKFPDNKKGQHPRLLFSNSDIDGIVNNLEHSENKEWYRGEDGLTARADAELNLDKLEYKNKYIYIDKYESQAFLYAIGKRDDTCGKEAIAGIIEVLKFFSSITKEGEKNYDSPHRPRDYAVAAAGRIYDWCYDLLTEQNKLDIFTYGMKNTVFSEFHFPYKITAYGEGHQYEQKILRDNLTFAIAVYDEFPDLYNYVAGFLNDELIPVLNYHFDKGSMPSQGDDYGDSRLAYPLWTATIFEKLGVNSPISEKQKDMAYMNIIRRRFDTGHIMRAGDKWSGDLDVYETFNTATSNFLAYNLYNDPYIKKAYQLCSVKDNYKSNINHAVIPPFMRLILNNVGLEPKDLEELPLSNYMGDEMGVMTARTSWDENAMIVSMGTPEHFYGGHQHLDAGNFEIYYKNPLAIDSGYYDGVTTLYRKNYTKRTIAHNAMLLEETITVDDKGQILNDEGQRENDISNIRSLEEYTTKTKIGEVLSKGIGSNYTYLKGDITGAYSQEKLNEYTRSFMFLDFNKEGTPGALIVLDKVTVDNPSIKKTWLLHTINEPEFDGDIASQDTIQCTCKSDCTHQGTKYTSSNTSEITAVKDGTFIHNKTLLPVSENQNLTVSKLKGNWNGTYYYPNGEKTNDIESNGWRVEVSPSEANTTDYFLNVISVGDEGENVYDSTLYECENYVGVKINDFVSFMSKNSEKTTDEFEIRFSDNSDNDFNIVVSDLEGGMWFVKDKDGKVIYNCTVETDNGTFSFKAPEGTYTLFKETAHPISNSLYAFTSANDTIENDEGTYEGPSGTVFAMFSGIFNNYEADEFGIAISDKELSAEEFIKDNDIIYAEGLKKTDDFRFGIRFYGKAIKTGHTYYTLPYVKYKDSNGNVITVYGNQVVTFTPEVEKI